MTLGKLNDLLQHIKNLSFSAKKCNKAIPKAEKAEILRERAEIKEEIKTTIADYGGDACYCRIFNPENIAWLKKKGFEVRAIKNGLYDIVWGEEE